MNIADHIKANEILGVGRFTQSGEGAVARTTQDKLGELISVKDFGAVGDGVADDTAAIQRALDAQAAATTSRPPLNGIGGYKGYAPVVFFPRGTYQISDTLLFSTAYASVRSEDALLVKASTFNGTHALEATTNGWRMAIEGLQFEGFDSGLYLNSNNTNSGRVLVRRCGFFNCGDAVTVECRSSIVIFDDCIWRSNRHEIVIDAGDMVIMRGGWISRGLLVDDYDGGIVNGTALRADTAFYMEDTVTVPTLQTVVEPCWIKNYGSVVCRNVRFGGEGGQHTVVNNFVAGSTVSTDQKQGITIESSRVYVGNGPAVRLFEIPHSIRIVGNVGFTGTSDETPIQWSASVDSTAQATKVSAIGVTQINHVIEVTGNQRAHDPAVPANLQFITDSRFSRWIPSLYGNARITFDLRDTSIEVGDNYGSLDWVGRDASGGAAGTRAQIRVLASSTGGAAELILSAAGHAAPLPADVAKIISTGLVSADDNGRTLGAASDRWSEIFAVNDTINTSDAREKTSVAPMSSAEIAAARDIAREIGTFQWLDAVQRKGADQARRHIGLTAQRVIEVMESHGLDAFQYGFICYDEWEEQAVLVEDSSGDVVRTIETPDTGEVEVRYRLEIQRPAGNRYGLRYGQLQLFIASGFEARLRALEGA